MAENKADNNIITGMEIKFHEIPWLQKPYDELIARFKSATPPHALMIYSKVGIGKARLVDNLVKGILCLQPVSGQPCEQCQSCRWLASDFHPDFYEIKGDGEIKVDEIRKIHQFVQLTPETGRKVVVIKQADRMNLNAANSLLKVLEEPPSDLFFILESSSVEKLPITVRSRCQDYFITPPSESEALIYLQGLIAGKITLPASLLSLLLSISFDAPFTVLQYLQAGQQERITTLLPLIQELFEGEIFPAKGVITLLESEDFSFALLFFLLITSFNDAKVESLSQLSLLFTILRHFPEKLRLTQYEKLVEINRLRAGQTRTDWALEAWFVEFLS